LLIVGDAHQPADLEVLAGLGHHPVVRRHNQHDQVDGARARQHVPDELLVPGHVDDGDVVAEEREPEVGSHAPLFLFLEPVRVGAGQGANQCALTVVDVPGGTHDDVQLEPLALAVAGDAEFRAVLGHGAPGDADAF
jgi:hypothetical protein